MKAMRAEIVQDIVDGRFDIKLYDGSDLVGISEMHRTDQEAKDFCRKYFPQYALPDEKPTMTLELIAKLIDEADKIGVHYADFRSRLSLLTKGAEIAIQFPLDGEEKPTLPDTNWQENMKKQGFQSKD
jgi:hypothetical protein